MGKIPSCYKSDYEDRFHLKIGEMKPIYPTVNDTNNYKKYNTADPKSRALGSGVFTCTATKSDEYFKTRVIQLKEFEEHTVKAGTFRIFDTVQERCVGRLDYYKALNVDSVDVCRAVDIILDNFSFMDPTDGEERINLKYFSMMRNPNYRMEELFKDYEQFKKYGFWCAVYFYDSKFSSDLFSYKQVLTQFKDQPVAKEIYASMAFCNFGEGQHKMIVKEENLYLSTALINLAEFIRIGYGHRFLEVYTYFFACDLGPPSYEEVVSDNKLESI